MPRGKGGNVVSAKEKIDSDFEECRWAIKRFESSLIPELLVFLKDRDARRRHLACRLQEIAERYLELLPQDRQDVLGPPAMQALEEAKR